MNINFSVGFTIVSEWIITVINDKRVWKMLELIVEILAFLLSKGRFKAN